MAEGAAMMGFGGVRSAALRVVAIVDLANAEYEQAHQTLKPLVDRPFFHVAPLSYPDFVEAAARTGRSADAIGVVAEPIRFVTNPSDSPRSGSAQPPDPP